MDRTRSRSAPRAPAPGWRARSARSVPDSLPARRAGPRELLAQHFVEGLSLEREHRDAGLGAADLHLVPRSEEPRDLPVDGEARPAHALAHADAELLVRPDEERTEHERMRAD